MSDSSPTLLTRLALAWKTIMDAGFAARVNALEQTPSTAEAKLEEPAPSPLISAAPDSALQLLGLLQQEGRLIDFLQEDVSAYSDADIGGAARVVHEGCRKVMTKHLRLEAISDQDEGTRMTLESGFDASAFRLTGNVVGQAPFTGTVTHRGWRATEINLPRLAEDHDVSVLAAAELEL